MTTEQLEFVDELFAAHGAELERTLHTNYYGSRSGRELIFQGNVLVLTPTDSKDHLVTDYVTVPFTPGKPITWIKIVAYFPVADSLSKAEVLVQDSNYEVIARCKPITAFATSSAPQMGTFGVGQINCARSPAIRLCIKSSDGTAAVLPSKVAILRSSVSEELKPLLNARPIAAVQDALREKWGEIPATLQESIQSSELVNWKDEELLNFWSQCRRASSIWGVRGWYQEMYAGRLAGANVLDVGCGLGIDGMHFAKHGARLTFADIVQENLRVVERVCKLNGVCASFHYIDDFFRYRFSDKFDCVMFLGSFHHAPFEFNQRQAVALLPHLRIGGTILMLAYPRERFERSGCANFEEFGKHTDGASTPWAEWYDAQKVQALFGPQLRLNWSKNFGHDNIEFNWFELTKIGD